ncbi:hypothetical protein AGLY_017303 [Aphis glycines]|uniref:Transmembrane protein n=1 Tax=Aphis glycines TaxID=307491 RepID=A0A6G0SVK0_APHGL|nr:hypothetical protein AGLY_017303 [Aphis glycines]
MLQLQTSAEVSEVKTKNFPTVFKKIEKNKKSDGKTGIFTQNQFLIKSIFLYAFLWFKFLRNMSKSRKYANNLVVKNSTLNFPYVFLQIAIEKTRSIIKGTILTAFEFNIFTKLRNDNARFTLKRFKIFVIIKKFKCLRYVSKSRKFARFSISFPSSSCNLYRENSKRYHRNHVMSI